MIDEVERRRAGRYTRSIVATLLRGWIGAGVLALVGCGRTPVYGSGDRGCDGVEVDVPSLSCEPGSCQTRRAVSVPIPDNNVLIVQDRSCSMARRIGGSSKWARAVEAMSAMLSSEGADQLRWGLSLFPDGDTVPAQDPPLVAVADDRADVIVDLLGRALDPSDPNHPQQPGEPCVTNLGSAVHRASQADTFESLDGDDYVVLITDGLAEIGSIEDPTSALGAIVRMERAGTLTFVVGFGDEVASDNLEELGQAGGVPAPGRASYYEAGLDDLNAALRLVLRQVQCSYRLQVDDADLPSLVVRLSDGTPVPNGTPGWTYDPDAERIAFSGQACDLLQAGAVAAVELELDCG